VSIVVSTSFNQGYNKVIMRLRTHNIRKNCVLNAKPELARPIRVDKFPPA